MYIYLFLDDTYVNNQDMWHVSIGIVEIPVKKNNHGLKYKKTVT